MEYITSKVFIIAVGIFVTIMIVTGVIFVFTKMGEIYDATENTNTSILSQYDNLYSMYSGANLNTVGLLNTLRKYEDDTEIDVKILGRSGEELYVQDNQDDNMQMTKRSKIESIERDLTNNIISYEELFDVNVQENNLVIEIVFKKI